MSSSTLAPAVSLIVPVYKSEATLGACLDSLLAQTEADIEIICVNDGSPDSCASILESYASRDARICVITQQNQGLSAARNAGMDVARGRIVDFVDSDDTVSPDLCRRLVEVFDATDADAVTFGAVCEPEDRASKRIRQLLSPAAATFDTFDAALLFSANAQPYAWRTAMRRTFMERENIRFSTRLRFAEDVPYQFIVYPLSKKTVLIPDRLYRYRMTDGSLTHVYNTEASRSQKVEQHLLMFEVIFDEWCKRGLLGLCSGEMVAWCLDLTLFDLVRLPSAEADTCALHLSRLLRDIYGGKWYTLPPEGAQRRAALAVAQSAESGFEMRKRDLIAFFAATRGVKTCVERFI